MDECCTFFLVVQTPSSPKLVLQTVNARELQRTAVAQGGKGSNEARPLTISAGLPCGQRAICWTMELIT